MTPKRTKPKPNDGWRLPEALALAVLMAWSVPGLSAQAAPAPANASTDVPADEQVISLSPFEVDSTKDNGYAATSSLAGSRLNTDLRDVAAAVQVVTPEFAKDIGATNLQKLLVYTTNTEIAGIGGNYYGGDT